MSTRNMLLTIIQQKYIRNMLLTIIQQKYIRNMLLTIIQQKYIRKIKVQFSVFNMLKTDKCTLISLMYFCCITVSNMFRVHVKD